MPHKSSPPAATIVETRLRTPTPRNRLLAALPPDVWDRVCGQLTRIPIRPKQILHRSGDALHHVYFPNGGVMSITTVLSDGTTVEAATVGDEGMIGIEAFLNDHACACGEILVQVPDTSVERMSVDAFRREAERRGTFRDLIGRYAESVIAQMMQSTACNAMHPVQQRCARWLLLTHDRMHEHDFQLSHEFLAVMLGVQRPTVSIVAKGLQQAGLIRYARGRISVTDRKGLEAASCECYATMRARFDRVRV